LAQAPPLAADGVFTVALASLLPFLDIPLPASTETRYLSHIGDWRPSLYSSLLGFLLTDFFPFNFLTVVIVGTTHPQLRFSIFFGWFSLTAWGLSREASRRDGASPPFPLFF